jgi:hypothetical protein
MQLQQRQIADSKAAAAGQQQLLQLHGSVSVQAGALMTVPMRVCRLFLACLLHQQLLRLV